MIGEHKTLSLSIAAVALTFSFAAWANGELVDASRRAIAVQGHRRYRASFTILVGIEGPSRPLVAEGILEHRFPDRSRLTSGNLEVITIGRDVWARIETRWQRDETMSSGVEPDLHLAAPLGINKTREGQYAFRMSIAAYRSDMQRRLASILDKLVDRLEAFLVEGEVLLGEAELPREIAVRVKDQAPRQGLEVREATFRFRGFGRAYDIEPPEPWTP